MIITVGNNEVKYTKLQSQLKKGKTFKERRRKREGGKKKVFSSEGDVEGSGEGGTLFVR